MKDRILCVDDDQDHCDLLEAGLTRLGFDVTTTTSPTQSLDLAAKEPFDVILTDVSMGEMDGLALCERMLGTKPDVPVVVVTGRGSMETAIGAMRAGAYDFLTKPVDSKLLAISLARAAQHHRLQSEVKRLKQALEELPASSELIGESAPMERVRNLVLRVGATDASTLICGETGTGKELVARALHMASTRAAGPFVALNCAAVPPNLLESELFGHARGAFTDAKNSRNGLFVEASGGTLFLDEIGEMPLEMQAKLLRALQEHKVRPVGANTEVDFDARIVAATHRDLDTDVQQGRFRQDLFYRINVVRVDVPPLRERGSDVLTLASFFLERTAQRGAKGRIELSPQVAERLLSYDWPGNVRELENCIERAVALARFDHLTVEDLPEKIRAYRADRFVMSANDAQEIVTIAELERRYILRVIKLLSGNKARAAQMLGLDRRTLYRKLERYKGRERQEPQPLGTAGSVDGNGLGRSPKLSASDPEQATYLRTLFLERVAHELRGPIGVIDGAMQEFETSLGEPAAAQAALLAMMKRGVRRLIRMADRLQQTGQCERTGVELVRGRSDLGSLVRRSVDEAVRNEGLRSVRVQVDTPKEARFCDLDEHWMHIAFYEMASNAIRHARERVQVTLEQDADFWVVRFVNDNRNGADFGPIRFRPPKDSRGLGLALAIVSDVIRAHGGELLIQRGAASQSAETHVCVRIPCTIRSAAAKEEAAL